MPVRNAQFREAKNAIGRRLDEANNPVGAGQLYMAIKNIRPKGFRGSILKVVDFPTSWSVFADLSPAQISQDRESGVARSAWQETSQFGRDLPSNSRKLLFWRRFLIGYFTANPQPVEESDFPRWRKPSWMTEAEAQGIKDLISSAYQGELYSEMNATDRTDFNILLGGTPSADEEVIAEMSAEMDGEEETVVVEESTQTTSPNVSQPDLIESLYALYQPYWETLDGVRTNRIDSADLLRNEIQEGFSVKDSAEVILTLELLGYGYTDINSFLNKISAQKLRLNSIDYPTRSGYGAYFVVRLRKANNRERARKYRSSKAYEIMEAISGINQTSRFTRVLVNQFKPSNRPELKVMGFSGTESTLLGYQIISLNYIQGEPTGLWEGDVDSKLREAHRSAKTKLRNALEGLETASTVSTSRDSTAETQAQVERQMIGNKYEMLGAMLFRPQMTFRSEGDFIKRGSLNGRHSVVFYFVTQELSSYPIYRVVWGEHNFGVNGMQYLSDDNLTVERIKEIWNASGKLRRNGVIKLQRVTNAIEAQNVRNAWITHSRNESPYRFKIERYDSEKIDVDFSNISPMTRVLGDILRQDSLWTQGAQAEQSGAFVTKQQMINASKESFDQLTYAFELEAYVKQGSRQGASDTMNSLATNIDGALKFTSGSGRTLPVNEGQYSLVYDGSITTPNYQVGQRNRADEGFQGYEQAEIVSPVLFGKEGLNKIKYFCEIANEAGVRVNSSDGLHVHFDAHQRSPSTYKPEAWQLASLMYNYHVIHPVIDKYQNLGRALKRSGTNTLIEGSQWAKDFSSNQLKELKQFAQAKKTDYKELYVNIYGGDRGYREWSQGQNVSKYHQSRYRTVNIHASVSKNGTIEMRQGSPSTDYLYIQNWVQWMYYLIIVSKSGVFEKPRDRYGSSKYNEKVWTYCELFLPDNVASYITNTMYLVDGENIDMNRTVFGQRARIE